MVNIFLFETIFRNPDDFFGKIYEKSGLLGIILNSLLSITLFGFIFGISMGVWSWEPLQMVYSAVKVPLLILISIVVVLPSYYVVNMALGGRQSFLQLSALFLSCFSILTTILLAFVPVNLFFILTSPRDTVSYIFMVFLTLILFGFGGILSVFYMVEGTIFLVKKQSEQDMLKEIISVIIALGTLAFIGTQLAWFIRPWFNFEPNFIRPEISGNFYIAIIKVVFTNPALGFIFIGVCGLIFIPFFKWSVKLIQSLTLSNKID